MAEFLEALTAWGRVWAPVEREDGLFSLEVIDDDVTRARPDALRTIAAVQEAAAQAALHHVATAAGGRPRSRAPTTTPDARCFFGAHACDIHALKILDLLYLTDFADPYYRRNREQLTWSATAAGRTTSASATRWTPPPPTTGSTSS